MARFRLLWAIGGTLLFSALAFAVSCSADAYQESCSHCDFNASGSMDTVCYRTREAQGISCLTSAYPITYAKYAAENCSQIDVCASELSACRAQYSSGNDLEDCREGSVAICFAAADQCVANAARTCEGVSNPCSSAGLVALGALLALGFAASK